MTESIDKKLEALDILVDMLSQIGITYTPIENEQAYTLRLKDSGDDPYSWYIREDALDVLKEVLDNMEFSWKK